MLCGRCTTMWGCYDRAPVAPLSSAPRPRFLTSAPRPLALHSASARPSLRFACRLAAAASRHPLPSPLRYAPGGSRFAPGGGRFAPSRLRVRAFLAAPAPASAQPLRHLAALDGSEAARPRSGARSPRGALVRLCTLTKSASRQTHAPARERGTGARNERAKERGRAASKKELTARAPPLPPAYSACPLPLPEGALNYFKPYHSAHLLCVRPPPTADFLLPLLGLPSTPSQAALWLGAAARPHKGSPATQSQAAPLNAIVKDT